MLHAGGRGLLPTSFTLEVCDNCNGTGRVELPPLAGRETESKEENDALAT